MTCYTPPPSRTSCPEFTSKVSKKGDGQAIDSELPVTGLVAKDSYLSSVANALLPLCVCVLHRGREARGEDEKAGSKVRPSAPRASN